MITTGPVDETMCPNCGKDMKNLSRRYGFLRKGRYVKCLKCKKRCVVLKTSGSGKDIFEAITLGTEERPC